MKQLTEEQRKHYASELLTNPVFVGVMDAIERAAINRAVHANPTDHLAHQAALAEVRAVRTFRQHCEAMASNKPPPKDAPA